MATVLFALFLLLAAINIGYFLAFFSFSGSESSEAYATSFPVSVIVCAKNEALNLQNFLPSILEQDYPNFEVIVINDASSDNTLDIIEEFQQIDPRIKMVNVVNNEAFWANKKYALTLGIKKAQNDHLIFTDADCAPQSIHWLQHMASGFSDEKSIVLGYGGYFQYKKSFINKLIRFETLLTAIQYFSYTKLGNPYMGVGRNLAYTSKQFYKQKGFASHLHVRSGDDDLFVNEAATSKNISICDHAESITRSVPKTSIIDWFRQKRRHASVAKFYKTKDKLLLGAFYTTRLFFWTLLVILLSLKIYWQFVLGVLGLTLIIEGIVYFQSANKLDEKDLIWLFPILEPFLILSQLGIFIANTISKPSHWK
ncbi:glycosyltransferase [Zunongwangia endophytica]|uniref:Glycosyltransferase n=1 Tax=Zunongwangia endophytica TaxID=1808945 RepID=A0ABV8H7B1_9FLAO|nr:glycosyltransferase [Zunongwangia endophytica]MDN3596547.1 glycosyltransferase [Zunongwangia endophytica]